MSAGGPEPVHGAWREIGELPSALQDGRYVLLWVHGRPLVAFWAHYEDGGDWSTDDGLRPAPTLFAELTHPVTPGPIYDIWHDDQE